MTKTLYIVRHGNAVDGDIHTDDHERALSPLGLLECANSAITLLSFEKIPQMVLTSTSFRTRQTAECMIKAGCFDSDVVHYDDKMYLASAGELLHTLHALPDAVNIMMIVGHNPGLFEMIALLSHDMPHTLEVSGLPTCSVVAMQFPYVQWSDIVLHTGLVTHYQPPNV